jgi:hypothetical protein
MDTISSDQTNMIRTTIQLCADNVGATSAISAFPATLAQAETKLLLIDQFDQIAMSTSKGVTLDTNALRISMSSIGIKCASAVLAYAGSVKNNTLIAQVNYTEPKLNKLSKDEVDDVCQTIREVADLNMLNAQSFGINASDTSDLQSTINLYRIGMQNPRQAIINKSDAIRQIKQLIREVIDEIFKVQMDKMVNTLKKSNPSFVDKYYQARIIIQLGSSTTKIRGTVNYTENKKPIYAASVTLRNAGQSTIAYQTKSDNDGLFHISDIKPGNYDIEVTHPDFIAFSETNIHFAPGKKIQRKYILKKAAIPPISV